MATGLDNPRIVAQQVVAAAWQPSEGTPADPAGAQVFVCESCSLDRQSKRIHPGGSTGSQFPKDSEREVAIEPIATLRLHPSAHQLPLFLESLTAGTPMVNGTDTEFVFALQFARFFTFWRDDGHGLEQLRDCVVSRLTLSGADLGGLLAEVRIQAKDYAYLPSALTPRTEDVDFLAFSDGVVRSGLQGTPVQEFPSELELTLARRVTAHFGSETRPSKLISEGFEELGGTLTFRPSDGQAALFEKSLADAWDSLDVVFTRGSQELSLVFDRVKFPEGKLADLAPDRLGDVRLPFVAVERADASVPPVRIVLKS